MRKQLSFLLVGGAALCLPALAHAEDEPKAYPECTKAPSDSETAAAKGAYQAGNASFDEADYPRAITYWEDAYRRDCTANLLLKNLARAYELYGQKRQAVVSLETFLVREPGSPDKEQIQRRIEVLKKQIAAEKSAPLAATASVPPTSAAAQPSEQPQPVEPSSSHSGKRPILPLIVAGSGAVIGIVGAVVFAKGAKDLSATKDECAKVATEAGKPLNLDNGSINCPGRPDLESDGNSATNRRNAGVVVMGVGGVALVGGLIWYFVQPREENTVGTLLKPRVTPAVTPGFAGLSLSGAF